MCTLLLGPSQLHLSTPEGLLSIQCSHCPLTGSQYCEKREMSLCVLDVNQENPVNSEWKAPGWQTGLFKIQLYFKIISHWCCWRDAKLFLCSLRSCCYIWLYKGQRRWAVVYGGCNHLCDKEERWRLVWRSLQSSNWLVSWELRRINHALCRLKSFAFQSWVLYSVIPWLFTRGN